MTTTRVFLPTASPAVKRWLNRVPAFATLPAEDWADMQRSIGAELADREDIDHGYEGDAA